jgi:hypothetical protein
VFKKDVDGRNTSGHDTFGVGDMIIRATMFGLLVAGGILLAPAPAQAFCVVNEGAVPIDIKAGGNPPTYFRPRLMPGDRDCHVPRKPEGIMVEILETNTGRSRCTNSVPAKNASIFFGKTCRVKLD